MNIIAYTLNSFAKSTDGGNPAGVILNADALSENDMKKIAGIIGFSETAFVMNSDLADFKVRFFTPNGEVDICGHATLAAFYKLSSQGYINTGIYTQETKAGILNVEIKNDLSIMMNQNTPSYLEIIDRHEIADSLNIATSDMIDCLPVQIVSTGLKDILVPIKSMDVLNAIIPDFNKVSKISSNYNTIGYHLFTLESLSGAKAHCRNFAPLYAIPEESATGSSNGALACYLFKHGIISNEQTSHIVFEQGYSMKKPSEIVVTLTTQKNKIIEVKVGGKVLNQSEIEIEL